jgi:hypothetical protein
MLFGTTLSFHQFAAVWNYSMLVVPWLILLILVVGSVALVVHHLRLGR